MKKILFLATVVAAVLTGCKSDEVETPEQKDEAKTFTATFENSRAYLGEDNIYRWAQGDQLSVFTEDYSHRVYKTTTGDVTTSDLEYVSTTTSSEQTLADYNYAIFPYDKGNNLQDGVLYGTLPATQTYSENNLNSAIMVSQIPASSSEFVFKNSCALIKVNVKIAEDYENLHSVKSITISSEANKLAGPVTMNVADNDYTAVVDSDSSSASNSITLEGCQSAGMLTADKYLTFYIAIPAGVYEAEDLTISVLTSTTSAPFNKIATITKKYDIARSKYLEVSTTLAEDYGWFTQDDDEVIIKEDVTLTDKAIMTYDANLILQGFTGQDRIETVFDVPDHDMTITGWDLVNSGYAQTAENGPIVTFKKAEADYVMNTFTTTNSGIKGVTPNKITLKSLTITGELRTSTLGIYVHNNYTKPTIPEGMSHDQSTFNTEWNNVNVTNCQIPLYTPDYGAAVIAYGTALLKDCKVTDNSPAADVAEESHQNIYDMCVVNSANCTIDGGLVDRIMTWEHSAITLTNSATVEHINWRGNSVKATSILTINGSTVTTIDASVGTAASYGTRVALTAGAKVGTLILPAFTPASTTYVYSITVSEDSTLEKVIYNGEEMTYADFAAKYPDYVQ